MELTLFGIFLKKEIVHWNRMNNLLKTIKEWYFKYTIGLLAIMIISLFHYMFAIMHISYEIVLFIFANKQFKNNLQKLNDRL